MTWTFSILQENGWDFVNGVVTAENADVAVAWVNKEFHASKSDLKVKKQDLIPAVTNGRWVRILY